MKRTLIAVFVLLMVNSLVSPASAMLFDGKVVNITWVEVLSGDRTFYTGYGDITVGPGIEVLDLVANVGPLDITDTTLYIDFARVGTFLDWEFNGLRITDVNNTIPDFTCVSINPATNMDGFDSSRITFDANNIWVNFHGLTHYAYTIVLLEVSGGTVYSCEGFEYPMDQPFTLWGSTKKRVFPLKMSLVDEGNSPIIDLDISSPPVYQVDFSDTFPNPLPDSTSAPLDSPDEGNQFIFRNGKWELNIPAGNFSAPGTYTIRAITGDICEYTINPTSTCEATFVIPKKEGKKGRGPK